VVLRRTAPLNLLWLTVLLLHCGYSPSSSSGGPSYDLSIAARKLSLQPRPLTMCGRGLWKGSSSFLLASVMAVCRLSRELDFFSPSVGPNSTPPLTKTKQRGKIRTHMTNQQPFLFILNIFSTHFCNQYRPN